MAGGNGNNQDVAMAAISQDQRAEIETTQSRLLVAAQALVIDSPEAEEAGWQVVNGIGALRELIGLDFDPSKKAAHVTWKAIIAQEQGHLEALKEPDRIVRAKISAWKLEEQRVLDEATRKEQERVAAVAAEEQRAAEEQALAEAQKLEASGDKAGAEEVLTTAAEAEPVAPVYVPPAPPPPKVKGAGAMVTTWHFEVTDVALLPPQFTSPNRTAILREVRLLKEKAKIPGVRVFSRLEPRRRG